MEDKISQIKIEYLEGIQKAQSLKKLDEIFLKLFGKKGIVNELPKEFPKLSTEERRIVGPLFNSTKQELEEAIDNRRQAIREEGYKKLGSEKFTLQPRGLKARVRKGHLHPLTIFEKKITDLFGKLGFQHFDGPQIDSDLNNFQLLNIPEDHPSRDLQDTLYLDAKSSEGKLLLRTHTSNFWPRLMEKASLPAGRVKLPIRAMSFDRCFRYEAVDARHSHTFNQFEIAVVGEKGQQITMANLKYLSDYLLQGILGKEAKSRLRPKYYPFVEPGFGIDSLCVFCHGKGCKICSGTGWFEIAGAGMIHPNVFKATGLDPKKYTGLAWGFGPDRMLMLKHGIEDIRFFLEGDLKFLQNY